MSSHTHTLTGGVQQAIGLTQLAGGCWNSLVSTNTRRRLRAQGLDSGLRETTREWGQCVEGNCCVRLLGWILLSKQALNTLYLSLGSFKDYYDCKLIHYKLTDGPQ